MKITKTNLEGCFIVEPTILEDERGIFFESFNKRVFENHLGKCVDFVQDNQSLSRKGVIRGLHFQNGKHAQAKLVRVAKGEALDVVVDIRRESPTFGKYFKMKLSESSNKSLFIPKGMAHGFLSLNDETVFIYKCDNYYNKASERGIIYNDVDLGIDWEYPLKQIILSKKDQHLPSFKELLI